MKQTVLIFFNTKDIIYTNYVPGQNRYHLLHQDCPGQIPEGFQRDLPIMSSQDWSLGWDNAAIHIK
jgi:hypothetical protein